MADILKAQNGKIINFNNVLYIDVWSQTLMDLDKDAANVCGFDKIEQPFSTYKLKAVFADSNNNVTIGNFYTSEKVDEVLLGIYYSNGNYEIPQIDAENAPPWKSITCIKPDENRDVLVYRPLNSIIEKCNFKDGEWVSSSSRSCLYDFNFGNGYKVQDNDLWIYVSDVAW